MSVYKFNSLFYVKCKYMLLINRSRNIRNFVGLAEKFYKTNVKFYSAAKCVFVFMCVCVCTYMCVCVCVYLCVSA